MGFQTGWTRTDDGRGVMDGRLFGTAAVRRNDDEMLIAFEGGHDELISG